MLVGGHLLATTNIIINRGKSPHLFMFSIGMICNLMILTNLINLIPLQHEIMENCWHRIMTDWKTRYGWKEEEVTIKSKQSKTFQISHIRTSINPFCCCLTLSGVKSLFSWLLLWTRRKSKFYKSRTSHHFTLPQHSATYIVQSTKRSQNWFRYD